MPVQRRRHFTQLNPLFQSTPYPTALKKVPGTKPMHYSLKIKTPRQSEGPYYSFQQKLN